jgi:transcriptional regulator with XRE-family HTH domain
MARIHLLPRGCGPTPDREPEPLWRELLGRSLRAVREEHGGRLVDVAARAGISPQYLSEIERGRKEPSSEMIAAITGALGVDLADLLTGVADDIRQLRDAGAARRPARPRDADAARRPARLRDADAAPGSARPPRDAGAGSRPADALLMAA